MWSKPVALLMAVGLLLALVALAVDARRRRVIVFGLVAGSLSLLCVVATVGLVVPNYLMLTVPYWALVVAAGWDFAVRRAAALIRPHNATRPLLIGAALVVFVALAASAARDLRRAHDAYVDAYGGLRWGGNHRTRATRTAPAFSSAGISPRSGTTRPVERSRSVPGMRRRRSRWASPSISQSRSSARQSSRFTDCRRRRRGRHPATGPRNAARQRCALRAARLRVRRPGGLPPLRGLRSCRPVCR